MDAPAKDDIWAIQILALQSREKPTFESEYKKIMRWYSEKFHTPLHMVEMLDFHTLMLTKFEDYIQNLDPQEYQNYKRKLLYPEIVSQESSEDEDWVQKELDAALAAEQAKLDEKNKKTEPTIEPMPEVDIKF